MFSDHLKKIDHMPYKTMLGLAACLVILCQLVAMVLVVDGQVRKAEARETSLGSQRMAIAQCNESSPAGARQTCIQQVMAISGKPHDPVNGLQVQALTDSAPSDRGGVSIGKVEGLMPASFTIH
jgi:hypothetical protein